MREGDGNAAQADVGERVAQRVHQRQRADVFQLQKGHAVHDVTIGQQGQQGRRCAGAGETVRLKRL